MLILIHKTNVNDKNRIMDVLICRKRYTASNLSYGNFASV